MLTQHPERGAAFQGSMADRARQEAADVVAAYDFGAFGTWSTSAVATASCWKRSWGRAGSHGVLLDQPSVAERGEGAAGGGGARAGAARSSPGDFFAAAPPGGDAYVLSRVIHDWDDDAAVRILANCRRPMGEDGTLLLVEVVLPERAREKPAAIRMDLHMLTLLHGRERTAAEYERLLGRPASGSRASCRPGRRPASVSSRRYRRLRRTLKTRAGHRAWHCGRRRPRVPVYSTAASRLI